MKTLQRQKNKIFLFLVLIILFAVKGIPQPVQGNKTDDFKVKGFHIDLRIQVMTMPALKSFAKELADFGINTLVMEWEASYPYKNNATISNKLAYTREEIESFVSYCNNIGIDVIPLQQCFGHVEYILRNDRYAALREEPKDPSQICPLKTEQDSLLFSDLFADMASLHTSKYIHIGGDETYLLGHCAECSKKAATEGKSKLFVDYMKMICNIVVGLGKTPVMWADILLKHPEAATELPKQTIFIDWNYGWNTNYFGDISGLQKQGFTFWGAPSIRSHPDNWYVTEWEKHFNNQRDFIPYSRKAGYEGVVMTSWSTSGVYGFTWDSGNELIDMEQIRNNYPMSGFRILIAAYAQALKQQAPIDPEKFVVSYAKGRFGLLESDGEKLWKALTVAPELLIYGKPKNSNSISEIRKSNDVARKVLNELKPSDNKKEFEHFRLMADLRDFYLAFEEVNAQYNSESFNQNKAKELIPELEKLKEESKILNQRFTELNKGFLYDSEIRDQNRIRNEQLNVVYQRIIGERE